ncbi:cobalamin-dependent protein [Alkalibacter rhizosphaerae]|uniref:Cobalamin-dependent protein n=1 Tax=Alkalibacter rhizosphaerae TaxID=2815577 RepID=A0A974XE29_9FIRM|nr:cobalamin-dependent protein [Alkalibacter rhizosphaerae]QSX08147.1 cobalamin-dependent protein [Alkalibacter rhizosphaerae]
MSKLVDAIRELEENLVYKIVDEEIEKGVSPVDIVEDCNKGLVEVGNLFASGEYFLTELMFSVEIMEVVMEKIKPLLTASGDGVSKGKVIIGTVEGDIHDVGKNIVVSLLRSHGFEVIDLGIDVSVQKFVDAVRESDAKILGLSALLNTTYPVMKNVVDALKEAGLRDKVKVIIGGTITSEQVKDHTGADEFATQAMKGIEYCNKIYGH